MSLLRGQSIESRSKDATQTHQKRYHHQEAQLGHLIIRNIQQASIITGPMSEDFLGYTRLKRPLFSSLLFLDSNLLSQVEVELPVKFS